MKAFEIADIIEKSAPKSLAYSWDNVGILVGSKKKEVKKALITLDVNEFTVDEAVLNNCDMIISHHPMFFDPVKRINTDTSFGRMVKKLLENDITVFAAHTNMDTAKCGINAVLADIFELSEIGIIEENGEETGLGRFGKLKNDIKLKDFCELVKEKLNTPCVRVCGDTEKVIKTAAVASGSCSEMIPIAHEKGCDVIITGDMKYHEMMDNFFEGMTVIDAGHYPTEVIVIEIFEKLLKETDIEIIKSKNKDVFNFI